MIDMQKSTHFPPVLQLVFLLLFAVIGGIFFSILGFIIYAVFFDIAGLTDLVKNNGAVMDTNLLRVLQISSSVGIFIAGPLAFAALDKYKIKKYFHFTQPVSSSLIVTIIALMICGLPLLELVASLNQKMMLPDFLKDVELWMRQKEEQAAVLTKQLLLMKSYSDLWINLLMIAVIPAIGEELLFRGAMQNIFVRSFKNAHIAIWLTAIVFSAIHVQFFGFFPRMLLGVLFGYLLLWGKNLWLPILGHFLNNSMAVVMAFVMQQQGKSIDEIEKSTTFPFWGYLLSAIITLVLLLMFYKQSKKETVGYLYE